MSEQIRQKSVKSILLAEDDPDDRMLVVEAFEEAKIRNDLNIVKDGQELMDYLNQEGIYSEPGSAPQPGIILLDLNMPRKDGTTALEEIKRSPQLWFIPVVVLTTSSVDEDIIRSYNLGVNSFITKPVTYENLLRMVNTLKEYWFDLVSLPPCTDKNEP